MDRKDDFHHGGHAVSEAYPMDTYGETGSYDYEKQEPFHPTVGLNQRGEPTTAVLTDMDQHGQVHGGVRRKLKQRHMAMIALGGTIGTGIFINIGSSLTRTGPVGLWVAYIIMSIMVYSMTVALGEMSTLYPVAGGFTHFASRFCDEGLGFALGFNYAYSWANTLPVEIVAAAIVIGYWDSKTNPAVYMTVMMVAIWLINLFGARAYGEAEFWFSSMKVLAIVGLIILSFILMCGGGPTRDPIGFRYWRNPGPFNELVLDDLVITGNWGKFLAFFSTFVGVAFSFMGTEIIGVTLGEAENPRKTVPKAIRRVFWRIIMFYIVGVFFLSNLVPSNDERLLNGSGSDASSSPWVIAINNAGIKGLPSVINAVILIAAWSAGVSSVYGSSRTFYALALEGKLPRFMRYCTKRGLPIWCVTIVNAFGLLCYMGTSTEKVVEAFNWLYYISAISGMLTWWTILLAYLRFYYGLKKQGISRNDFPFKAPFQPYLSWFGFISFTLITLSSGFIVFLKGQWDVSTFFSNYVTIPIFAVLWFGWKFSKRTRWIPLAEIDFVSGRRELDAMEELDKQKFNKETGFFAKLSSILF